MPNVASHVVYADDATDLYVDGDYTVAAIRNATTSGLYIQPEASLVLRGVTSDQGALDFNAGGEITIQADEHRNDGILLLPKEANVRANVEFITKARSANTTSTSEMKWQYFGIPVE